jgi:hypothetical protein
VFNIGCSADIHTIEFRDHAVSEDAHSRTMRVVKALALTAIGCIEKLKEIKAEFRKSTTE